jgi:hypothetical protein
MSAAVRSRKARPAAVWSASRSTTPAVCRSAPDKAELLDLIDAYRHNQVPLIVPITLIRHHLRHHPHDYVMQQYYLNPHSRDLMLRNHI